MVLRWHIKERFKAVLAGSVSELAASRSCNGVLCPQHPREGTGTCPSLLLSCWFLYLATQSMRCHVKIPIVDASYSAR